MVLHGCKIYERKFRVYSNNSYLKKSALEASGSQQAVTMFIHSSVDSTRIGVLSSFITIFQNVPVSFLNANKECLTSSKVEAYCVSNNTPNFPNRKNMRSWSKWQS
jgi:hypothetical protein